MTTLPLPVDVEQLVAVAGAVAGVEAEVAEVEEVVVDAAVVVDIPFQ